MTSKEELRDAVSVMECNDFRPIAKRIRERLGQKVRKLISGSDEDERNRGWIEALEWFTRLPTDIRKEIADGVKTDGDDK